MKVIFAALTAAFAVVSSAASADSRVFIVANQSDGYGIDQCLAKGEKCGAPAALSYCRSREFTQAVAYRRVDPDEVTGSISSSTGACKSGKCDEFVAITCQR
ncbi:hypothetical protein E0H22_11145 [Rhodopseudomonas boonkerdii]|uniref:hypothetical protein n=1 Tax=Rhodopseudomonas boonkerdii TaxID=475937 RepID=UPI001E306682|nr:hypothetical protein [Rhodopseudomonas boonkerdii]UGV26197.1 hypothetical protein E0H22_11145 [Rhodopseudomonas boonkerdii]